MASWERLIRFVDTEGNTAFGEPILDPSNPDQILEAKLIEGDIFGANVVSNKTVKVIKVLAPILTGEIVGIGLNYKNFAKVLGVPLPENPLVFRKGQGSIQNPNDPIVLPKIAMNPPECDYEVELAVVIGKAAKNVSKEDALNYVLGYTIANDVSARLWHGKKGGNQLCFAKSFDTFFPFGPVIVSPKLIKDPQNLKLETFVNGELRQKSNTSDMNYTVADLISFLSSGTTLLPGTVISTGTPEGTGSSLNPQVFLKEGDSVRCSIEGIGALVNPVVEEK